MSCPGISRVCMVDAVSWWSVAVCRGCELVTLPHGPEAHTRGSYAPLIRGFTPHTRGSYTPLIQSCTPHTRGSYNRIGGGLQRHTQQEPCPLPSWLTVRATADIRERSSGSCGRQLPSQPAARTIINTPAGSYLLMAWTTAPGTHHPMTWTELRERPRQFADWSARSSAHKQLAVVSASGDSAGADTLRNVTFRLSSCSDTPRCWRYPIPE